MHIKNIELFLISGSFIFNSITTNQFNPEMFGRITNQELTLITTTLIKFLMRDISLPAIFFIYIKTDIKVFIIPTNFEDLKFYWWWKIFNIKIERCDYKCL